MKRAILIGAMVVGLLAAFAYADMHGEMMKDMGGMDTQGFDDPKFDDPGFGMEDMGMPGADMTDIRDLMNQMASMMKKLSSLMDKDPGPVEQKELADIAEEMSGEMSDMARLLSRGGLSMGDVQDLKWRMKDTEERLGTMM